MRKRLVPLFLSLLFILCFSGIVHGATTVTQITGLYNSTKGADLRWKPVSGAEKYVIYRTNAGKRVKIKTVPSGTTSYYDTQIQNNCWGKVYVYAVSAIINGKEYSRSEGMTLQRLAPMRITTLKSSSANTAFIQYIVSTGSNKALGYEIQYAKSKADLTNRNGTFKSVSVNGRQIYTKTISGLTADATYYFRVRAYVNYTHSVTGKTTKTWSQYSDIKSVKIMKPAPIPTPTPLPGVNYQIKNVHFEWYRPTYSDTFSYDAVVTIHNAGSANLYLRDAAFEIQTNDGVLIASKNYVNKSHCLLRPNEDGYFYYSSSLPSTYTGSTPLKFIPNIHISRAIGTAVYNTLSNVSIMTDSAGDDYTIGKVTNQSPEYDIVSITAVFFDQNGRAIGAADTYLTNMSYKSTKEFKIHNNLAGKAVQDKRYSSYKVFSQESYYQFS